MHPSSAAAGAACAAFVHISVDTIWAHRRSTAWKCGDLTAIAQRNHAVCCLVRVVIIAGNKMQRRGVAPRHGVRSPHCHAGLCVALVAVLGVMRERDVSVESPSDRPATRSGECAGSAGGSRPLPLWLPRAIQRLRRLSRGRGRQGGNEAQSRAWGLRRAALR